MSVWHRAGDGVDLVIDVAAGVPVVLHWGPPLGPVDPERLVTALATAPVGGALDVVAPVSTVPEHGAGYAGRPGLAGRRPDGTAWSPRFRFDKLEHLPDGFEVVAVDPIAGLRLVTELRLGVVLEVACTLHNDGDDAYWLDGLTVTLPVPATATELLTWSGRWSREFHPERRAWGMGAWTVENRLGRTSHERPPLVVACDAATREWGGEAWAAHLAWSGNHVLHAEHLPDGRRTLQLGELLHPGEVVLGPGESYRTPTVVAAWSGDGLTALSQRYHRHVRSFPAHPARPRPVLLNTWEAVYFDHDADRLRRLATTAASIGIERFVLDDGWFGSRRDDRSGLGDWTVSADRYPDGLAPLIEHVTGLGMEFGIWVEPEMVNPDSDLHRAHPDWALATEGYEPVLGRNQLVLDLARPEAFAHVLGHLDRLLADHDIAYVKWDMNRPHVQGSGADGRAGTRAQVLATYRLLDELRARHPGVEFETCAAGGGRIDLEILRRTERVWTSDCNDALERQTIQWGTSMLVPPELMGAHIGPTRAHTTGRSHSLAFRAVTAMFGHLGVEWNLLGLDAGELESLARAIAVHRRFRPLLHGGDVVRFDPLPDGSGPSGHAHGVYATDRSEALVARVQLRTGASLVAPPLRLPGLDPEADYRIEEIVVGGHRPPMATQHLTGRQLAAHGLRLPPLFPESALLLHLQRVAP